MRKHQLFLVLIFGIVVSDIESRPQTDDFRNIYPVYRAEKQLKDESTTTVKNSQTTTTTARSLTSSSELPNENKKGNIEEFATVARASVNNPLVIMSSSNEDKGEMVDADIRTPPKLKEILKEKETEKKEKVSDMVVDKIAANGRFDIGDQDVGASEGKASHGVHEGVKGVAVPVIMDEVEMEKKPPKKMEKVPEMQKPTKPEKKKTNNKVRDDVTTTPSSGLSTWILLSDNRESTTPSIKKKPTNKDDKKSSTTKKPQKSTTNNPEKERNSSEPFKANNATKKATPKPLLTKVPARTTESSITDSATSVLEAMVKNKKGQTTIKPKTTTKKTNKDKAETKDKVEILLSDEKKVVTIPPALPLTTESSTEAETTTVDSQTESSSKKKKTTNKKRKKNKNRRKKPGNGTDLELKKNPKQPVSNQFYNYLSREIMPTVGLGLVGVLVTAGLAGLLGYNPFVAGGMPIRRTYESKHGYSPNYYQHSEYDNDGGQSEEVLFREVLQGMPEDSRYSLSSSNAGYPETQLYSSQEQAYSTTNKQKDSYNEDFEGYYSNHNTNSNTDPGTSYVYPEKSSRNEIYGTYGTNPGFGVGQVEKVDADKDTIEKQPEALYRVADEEYDSDKNWHRIGSAASSNYKRQLPNVEPGPRNIKIRRKRSVIQRIARKTKSSQEDNEIDNEIDPFDSNSDTESTTSSTTDFPSTTTTLATTTNTEGSLEEFPAEVIKLTNRPQMAMTTVELVTDKEKLQQTSTEDNRNNEILESTVASNSEAPETEETSNSDDSSSTDLTDTGSSGSFSIFDLLKRLTTLKLRLGLNFLKSTTDAFSRYLDSIQKRVDENLEMTNNDNNNYFYNYRRKNWSRSLNSRTKRGAGKDELVSQIRKMLKKEKLKNMNKKYPKSKKY